MKVYMELCPALQGGEIILCNYLVTGNTLSELVYEPAYCLTLTCVKGHSLWSMVINNGRVHTVEHLA